MTSHSDHYTNRLYKFRRGPKNSVATLLLRKSTRFHVKKTLHWPKKQ